MRRSRSPAIHFTRAACLLLVGFCCSAASSQTVSIVPGGASPEVQVGDAPRLHAPPISLSAGQTWVPVSLGTAQTDGKQPGGSHPPAQSPDETERAIGEIRQRVGSVGNRFSDLVSPGDAERLFSEALQQVRDQIHDPGPHQSPSQPQPHSPRAPQYSLQREPHPGSPHSGPGMPQGPESQAVWPRGSLPQTSYPGPQSANLAMPPALPGEVPRPGLPPGWQQVHQPFPGSPGRPGDPLAMPHPPVLQGQEPEPLAMRRIARELDRLAEELENIRRFAEADALRRTAQSYRESVR